MKILLNQKEVSIDSHNITLSELIELNQLPAYGIAIALNNKVVRKTDWNSTFLNEGDSVTIITAVCGG